MVNYSKKIAQALSIIRKYYNVIYTQKTDNENVVYLFNYTHNKKTIGSDRISEAVNKAMKQQDFPKDIFYSNGMLSVVVDTVNETVNDTVNDTVKVEEPTVETEKPKKRGRKKQTETEIETETNIDAES